MNEEEKKAIEYIKSRLYGNEGCDYIDVAQEDLRIFINLVDRKEKDIEGWKKYCEEIEEEQTEMSNKNCELEFEVEKLQKENEELKEENELNKIIKNTKLDELFCRRNGKKVEQAIKLRDELLKLPECKLYGIKKCKKNVILIIKEEVIPIQKVKEKISERQFELQQEYKDFEDDAILIVLQELLEGRE